MKKYILLLISGAMMFGVAGCGSSGGNNDPVTTPTPTATVTPTTTPTTTPTPTATAFTTPTINGNTAGNYPINLSYKVSKGSGPSYMVFVIKSIDVQRNGSLVFNCSWTAEIHDPDNLIVKKSDKSNTKIYLQDNLGTKYNHTGGSGIAYSEVTFSNSTSQTGSFTFPAVGSTVTSLTFYDNDNGKTIGPISVIH